MLCAGARPRLRTTCLKTQTSEHPCQRGGPSPWGPAFHYAYEAHGELQSLHPDKMRHGACLERLPQTAKTAPRVPLGVQNATSKPVNDTQACSVEYRKHGIHSIMNNTLYPHVMH